METKRPDELRKTEDVNFEKRIAQKIEKKFHRKVLLDDRRLSDTAKQI